MKKKLSATLGALAICALLAGLGGCSNSSSETQNSNSNSGVRIDNAIANATEPVTPSKLLNTKSIWFALFKADSDHLETSEVWGVYVFDGEGNLTYYSMDRTGSYLSDFYDLSEDEIIEVAKEKDKNAFPIIVEQTRDCAGFPPGLFQSVYDLTCDEANQKLDNVEYEEPQPVPFQLKLRSSGDTEIFHFNFSALQPNGEYGEATHDLKVSLFNEFEAEDYPAATGNTYYSGYSASIGQYPVMFFTIINKDHPGFILDTSGTDGVTIE